MDETIIHSALLIEEQSLTLDELASACGMHAQWLAERIDAELIAAPRTMPARFGSADLIRARRLAQLEKTFDINADAAAFMVDLIEEVTLLRRRLEHAQAGAQVHAPAPSPPLDPQA
ncbi:MAG: chaperone modulator CbpM [Pseudomonadota bacterium]